VKNSRFGLLGSVLYNEANIYRAAATAKALKERFPNSLLPIGFSDPVLSAFANAVLHCSTCAEVAVTLNEAVDEPPAAEAGATAETAIVIHATNSLEGIPKEYAALSGMFGTRNRDWKLIERSVIHGARGRQLEKFIVSASNQRKEVYFDITEWFAGNTSKDATAALERLITPCDKPLPVLLPKEEFMTLQGGLLRLTEPQLNQIGLSQADWKNMLDPFLDALKQWHGKQYESIPEHVSVTALISVWTKIMGLLASWQPADLLQEEELENLKAIIGGTIKDARQLGLR
jgi:hypothetical protein